MDFPYEVIGPVMAGAAAGAAAVGGIFRVRPSNRRTDAESAKILAQAYGLFVDDLRNELAQVRSENAQLRERIATLEAQISALLARQDKV